MLRLSGWTARTFEGGSTARKLLKLGKRLLALLTLIVGILIAVSFWSTWYEFAHNRSAGYGWSREIAFWDGLPAIEAGLFLGVLFTALSYNVRGKLVALSIVIWTENLFNLVIIFSLVSSGALF
ncbi:MAG: hypothetical protein WBW04_02640 [Nitrolancea sp.]